MRALSRVCLHFSDRPRLTARTGDDSRASSAIVAITANEKKKEMREKKTPGLGSLKRNVFPHLPARGTAPPTANGAFRWRLSAVKWPDAKSIRVAANQRDTRRAHTYAGGHRTWRGMARRISLAYRK